MMLQSSLRNCSGVNTIGSSSRNVPPVIRTRSIGLRCVSNISHSIAYSNTCRMTLLMWDLVFCARGRVRNQRSTASGLTAPRSREPHFGRTCFVRLLRYPPPVVNLFGIRSAMYFWAASPNFATDAVGLVLLLAAKRKRSASRQALALVGISDKGPSGVVLRVAPSHHLKYQMFLRRSKKTLPFW